MAENHRHHVRPAVNTFYGVYRIDIDPLFFWN